MARLTDWRARLHALIAANADRAFEPGRFDCSLFTAECIEAITGVDHAAAYRGNYTTVEEGQALLAADGYEDHVAFAESLFIFERPSMLQAETGDIAVIRAGSLIGLGCVIGDRVAVVTERGLGHLPLSLAVKALQV